LIKTKSIYEPKSKSDGHRILITRYYPRGVKKTHFDDWVRELAPSRDLLKDYKLGEIEWSEFEHKFQQEVDSSYESIEMIYTLADLAKNESVTLLCYEKSGTPCHRYLIENLIRNEMGQVPELLTKIS